MDPDQKPADLDLHCFQYSLYKVSYCFKEFICVYCLSTLRAIKAKFFMHYLFFGTSKTLNGQVPYGNLLDRGQISTLAISTPLLSA